MAATRRTAPGRGRNAAGARLPHLLADRATLTRNVVCFAGTRLSVV
jgi:hypothetical protein